jgi:Calcineurin-like phosphoesterase
MTMIAQVLNRDFMLTQLGDIQTQLRADVADKRAGGPIESTLQTDDYGEALAQIEQALRSEQEKSSGQPGFVPPPPERRSDWPADLDDYSFLSRDPIVSIVQSAIELYFDQPEHADEVVTAEPADDARRGSDDEPMVTSRTLRNYSPSRDPDGRRAFDKFSITDIGWVASAVAMGVRLFRKRRDFNATPPQSIKLDGQARVILVGDWGSGLPRAQKVGALMRRYVEEGLSAPRDVQVIHLGDVYYSGWEYEYKKRFLPFWPVWPEEATKAGSWSLNGNHDMYSGGFAYFDTLLADARFAKQAQTSFFHLYNDDWQIFGLDTAWDDNGLKDPQAEFVMRTLANHRQKAIALTHHQFFSAYEPAPDCGKVLREKLGAALDGNRIHAAFWGHEHRAMLYKPWQNIQYGRLLGHGGVPVYMTHAASDGYVDPAIYEDRRSIDKGLEHWAYFGFAVLDFAGPQINVRYIDENGYVYKEETIV